MKDIANKSRPRRAIEKPPRGWLEPANVRPAVPTSLVCALHAFPHKKNMMLFAKTQPESYRLADRAEDLVDVIQRALAKAGGSALVDDGVYCSLVCRPGEEDRWLVVDPHCERSARVSDTDTDGIRRMVKSGAMVLVVTRDV